MSVTPTTLKLDILGMFSSFTVSSTQSASTNNDHVVVIPSKEVRILLKTKDSCVERESERGELIQNFARSRDQRMVDKLWYSGIPYTNEVRTRVCERLMSLYASDQDWRMMEKCWKRSIEARSSNENVPTKNLMTIRSLKPVYTDDVIVKFLISFMKDGEIFTNAGFTFVETILNKIQFDATKYGIVFSYLMSEGSYLESQIRGGNENGIRFWVIVRCVRLWVRFARSSIELDKQVTELVPLHVIRLFQLARMTPESETLEGRQELTHVLRIYENVEGRVPLVCRAIRNFEKPQVVQGLLTFGADANGIDTDGKKSWQLAMERYIPTPYVKNYLALLRQSGIHICLEKEVADYWHRVAFKRHGIQVLFPVESNSLKCIAARKIARSSIPYKGQVPRELESFVGHHNQGR